jgi:hypothetical protein
MEHLLSHAFQIGPLLNQKNFTCLKTYLFEKEKKNQIF